MAINLADNNPRVVYTVAEGVTQTVFAVPFEFFEDADINIYVDGVLKTEGTDYTLTGGEGATGTLTFVTAEPGEAQQVTGAVGGSTVVMVRRIAIERTSDFQQGMDISRSALNTQLDVLTALVADMNDRWDRAVHLDDSDTGQVNFVLPSSSARAGNYFAFDANGDPVMTSGTTSTLIVSAFAETFLDDDTGAEVLNTLGVTASPAELNTLYGVTASTAELNKLDGVTWTLTDYNALTATAADLNQLDGITLGTGATANALPEATWEAGTDTTETVVSPAKVKAAVDQVFVSRRYKSSNTTIANNGLYSFSHGLGVIPDIVQVYLQCTTSDANYDVGDIIQIVPTVEPDGGVEGISVLLTSSVIEVIVADNGPGFYVEKGATFGYGGAVLNASSWELYVVALSFQ